MAIGDTRRSNILTAILELYPVEDSIYCLHISGFLPPKSSNSGKSKRQGAEVMARLIFMSFGRRRETRLTLPCRRITPTASPTRITWAPSIVLTFALRSLNTLREMRSPFAI